jgi:serine/threonine-protein kinase RsbT
MIMETDLLRRLDGEAVDTLDETATIAIDAVADIVTARQRGREMALRLGFSETESTLIATIISELARNIVLYAQSGEIKLERATSGERRGLIITCRDNGPGIPDVQRAMVGGYSTSGGLGLGLCGVQRMVDELDIDTKVGKGTTITAKKWLY